MTPPLCPRTLRYRLARWWRSVLCIVAGHQCRPGGDDLDLWAECIHCGTRCAYLSRFQVRRYLDEQELATKLESPKRRGRK